MGLKFANNATAFLAAAISASDTSLALTPGAGDKFPILSPGDWHPVTLVKSNGDVEIVRVTARSGDVLTVDRAQDGGDSQLRRTHPLGQRHGGGCWRPLAHHHGQQRRLRFGLPDRAANDGIELHRQDLIVRLDFSG